MPKIFLLWRVPICLGGQGYVFFVDLSSPWTASIESVVCSYKYRSACEIQRWWNCSHPNPTQQKPLPAVPRSLAESRFLLQHQPSWSILPSICLPGRATRTARDGRPPSWRLDSLQRDLPLYRKRKEVRKSPQKTAKRLWCDHKIFNKRQKLDSNMDHMSQPILIRNYQIKIIFKLPHLSCWPDQPWWRLELKKESEAFWECMLTMLHWSE